MKRPSSASTDEAEARLLYPPARLPDGLASTARMVEGIRRKIADRQAAALRRLRFLGVAGALATCAAIAIAVAVGTGQVGGGGVECAQGPAPIDEEAFARYEREFAVDPEEEAFEALDTLISALDYDFSGFDLQSI